MKKFVNWFVVVSAICSILSLCYNISDKSFDVVTVWNIIFLCWFSFWINYRIDSNKESKEN